MLLKDNLSPCDFEGADWRLTPWRALDEVTDVRIHLCMLQGHFFQRHEFRKEQGLFSDGWLYRGFFGDKHERLMGNAVQVLDTIPKRAGRFSLSDFSDCDWRVTSWKDFDGHGGAKAYRIHLVRVDQRHWFQRHEWQIAGRNSTDVEGWIALKAKGALSRWPDHFVPFEGAEELEYAA